ncbi:MAG: hypothetical protein QOE90_738 [Thermoplasmata archaeon]|jgi:hypothetical protein|nr:hypothetical protein [Thermoplasmata archaeon]
MPRPVNVKITREIPMPVPQAFAWLTDFQDDDAQRAGAVVARRKVVERSATRSVYEGETEVLGRRNPATTEVRLHPPDAWEARVVAGPRTGSWTTYKLTPSGTGSRLALHYRFTHEKPMTRVLMRLVKPKIRAELVKMWEGYEADMRREIAKA